MMSLRHLLACSVFLAGVFAASMCVADTPSGAPSTIVASQGDAIVTLQDLDAFAAGIPEAQRADFFNSPKRIEQTIMQLLLQKQLAAEARKLGLEKDALVQKQVALAEEEALSKARMIQFRKDLKLPDFDELAEEEFLAHKEQYVVHDDIEVEQVLISSKDRDDAQAKALASKVHEQAKADPAQFEVLVEKFSDDPSKAENHGLVTNAGDESRYQPAFAKAAVALKKPGEISSVVKTSNGYHVLKLVKRTELPTPKFADSKDKIVAKLRSDYIDKQLRTHAETLSNLPLDANADLVASLRTRYGKAGTPPADSAPAK